MPFKSDAQRRLFYAKMGRGEISKKTVKKWEDETPKKKLPRYAKKKIAGPCLDSYKGKLKTKKQVHQLADRLNIPWDDNPKFKRWTKKLTGKSCLDEMDKGELSVVYAALKKRGKEKTAEAKIKQPTAVIVKGNAEHLAESGIAKKTISDFHGKLKKILQSEGYKVSFDPGLPQTSPKKADIWVGHSRGADRLRFAPKGTLGVPVGSDRPGAINHPVDKRWMNQAKKTMKGRNWADVPVKERPPIPKEHLMVTPKMEKDLRSRVKGHYRRTASGKVTHVEEHIRKGKKKTASPTNAECVLMAERTKYMGKESSISAASWLAFQNELEKIAQQYGRRPGAFETGLTGAKRGLLAGLLGSSAYQFTRPKIPKRMFTKIVGHGVKGGIGGAGLALGGKALGWW